MAFKIAIIVVLSLFLLSCGGNNSSQKTTEAEKTGIENNIEEPLITFVELGSVNCIPCRKMQPVMKAIENKYGGQVRVIFYDVWKADQRKYASQYGIRLIPTQVFLDKEGREIFRHEGFFPEEEIDIFLRNNGLSPNKEK